MEIPEILEAFRIYDERYKREYVDAALEMREEITPHLIGILERLLSDPVPYFGDEYLFDHIYAVILLGYFREPRAHDTIVNVFSMPYEIPRDLFDDVVTEYLPAILYGTCGGSLDRIRELALNREAYDFCRSSALKAMVYAIFDGVLSREEILDFFGSLFTGDEAKSDSIFWSSLVNLICDLYPEELMPVIEKAFEDELIDLLFIDQEDVRMALERGKEATLESTQAEFQREMSRDIHEQLSWWFADEPVSAVSRPTSQGKKKKKAKAKKRKKMAKASRRRNRKKRR